MKPFFYAKEIAVEKSSRSQNFSRSTPAPRNHNSNCLKPFLHTNKITDQKSSRSQTFSGSTPTPGT
jgi:hypothetical protein